MNEDEQIIEQIIQQARILLQNHWIDISDFRDGEESTKIGFAALIKYEGNRKMIETKISFGKRVTDSIVDWIDPDQMKLGFVPEVPISVKRGPGRPKKNILEKVLTSEPSPDSAA